MFVDVRRDELISALKRVKGFTKPKHEVFSHVHVLVQGDNVYLGATDRYALLYRKIGRVAGAGDFEFTLSPGAVKFILGLTHGTNIQLKLRGDDRLIICGAVTVDFLPKYPSAFRFLWDRPVTDLNMEKGFTRFGVGVLKKMFSGCTARDHMNFGQYGDTGSIAFWKDDRELGLILKMSVTERSLPWN